jgi:hypothetical protein
MRLDTLRLTIYGRIMFRRTVAASVVAVWLLLLGVEFSEAAGLISRRESGNSVEKAIAGFGKAMQALRDSRLHDSPAFTAQLQLLFGVSTAPGFFNLGIASYLGKEAQFLKGHFKIFRLHRVLLI